MYALSENIAVFPTSVDRINDNCPDGKVLSEYNLSQFFKQMSYNANFVISYTRDIQLEFMLDGHYVNLTDSNILESAQALYAKAVHNTENTPAAYLKGDDTTGYQGIDFLKNPNSEISVEGYFQLLSGGEVPNTSWRHIDGGEI